MTKRRQKLLEDRQTILGRRRLYADENSLPISTDLIYEIFLGLSPKCIGKCRCVSKLWSSIVDRQEFTDLFLEQSSTRPQFLFACEIGCKVYFFSSAQPQNPEEYTPPITASYHMSLHLNHAYQIHSPIRGLVCTGDFSGGLNGRKRPAMVRVICNPRTRQSFTLPRMNTRNGCEVRSFFGYDPVEKQFKVLSMTLLHGKDDAMHQVLTLETGKLSWRRIECDVPHCPFCITKLSEKLKSKEWKSF
ncbi:hypothetical protein IGI04_004422 [Brassica rapa subsp. trilocularis]|uniref:F-box domain-containing protein n=2 Tax=Brassica campestris TaxID=3711 RepID=M4EIY5_BRACM|nr:F-box protein DOR-like [Brassica rapa]KAG5408103.1 hypothetical protein IGI04_004422 [Brassica rapa subsp. trilocularis]